MNNTLKANKAALVEYFRSGAKNNAADPDKQYIGIELEHIIVDEHMIALPYLSENYGVKNVLEDLQAEYPNPITVDNYLLGLSQDKSVITIEPCAQLELSSGPFNSLQEAESTFTQFETTLNRVLTPHKAKALTIGYDPHLCAREKTLIPKKRYEYMNKYLSQISMYGPCMMRCSASTQISIDYTDEHDALRKMRLASIATPLFALMTDNSPVFEGSVRTEHLVRTRIWKNIDPIRASTIPGITRPDFSFDDYADYILGIPAIVAIDEKGVTSYSTQTFAKIFKHRVMTEQDIEHALSMVFPDVRLKKYIEIRPADSMPVPYVIAYAALIKGLFYSEQSLSAMENLFGPITRRDIDNAKEALMANGYKALVYNHHAEKLCDELIKIAQNGLTPEEQHFLTPLSEMVEARSNFADLGGTIDPLERLKTRRDFL